MHFSELPTISQSAIPLTCYKYASKIWVTIKCMLVVPVRDSKQIGEVLWHIVILIKKSKCRSPLIIPITTKVLYLKTQSIIMLLLLLLLYFLLLLSSLLSSLLTILLFHSITHLVTSYCDQLTIQAASKPFAFKTNMHSLSFLVQLTRP